MAHKRLLQRRQLLRRAAVLHPHGRLLHRCLHRADVLVVISPQKIDHPVGLWLALAIAALDGLGPQRLQREGQQRQRIAAARIRHQLLLEPALQLQRQTAAGSVNHLAVHGRGHGLELERLPAQAGAMAGVALQQRQKIGAQRRHHQHPPGGMAQQPGEKGQKAIARGLATLLAGAKAKDIFELIDRQHQAGIRTVGCQPPAAGIVQQLLHRSLGAEAGAEA